MAPNRVVAKVSHPIVAKLFLSPPPPKIVAYLHTSGAITKEQAEFASKISMADAITVEADSGGHTDGRPLSVILPSIKKMAEKQQHRVFVGAAGGLGTPKAMAGAAALGADYLLLGSIHQSCVEAGTSGMVKQMLAKATITDTDMGIAPDMFERGAKVQVLTAGSLYAPRSRKLRELYLRYNSWAEIPVREQSKLEKLLFQASYEEIWEEVVLYWSKVDSRQLERAERIPKHKLALFFRWYLGQSSRWARLGIDERKKDFQVWCGPSMGAFNEWAVDNYVSEPHMRTVVAVSDLLWKQFKTLL
jgi:PfaD family protein